MDRKIAESLMVEMRKLDEIMNKITAISLTMAVEDAKSVRRVIGAATASAYTEIIRPIVKTFPDLDPDKCP